MYWYQKGLESKIIDKQAWAIGEAMLKGALLEAASYPTPGLVSSVSMGAHRDMNIITFMASSAALAPAFYLCAQAGRNHTGGLKELLIKLRNIGIFFDDRLLETTKGVNTQRGLLFAAGLICGAAGYLSQTKEQVEVEELLMTTAAIAEGIVKRELIVLQDNIKEKLTAGEQLYIKYKATGIRGEVEAGFPAIKKMGLPALNYAFSRGRCLNDCLVHTLVSLMTSVEDTTILWRKDLTTLAYVQNKAAFILERGSIFTEEGKSLIVELEMDFIEKNISPGGSADLLAVTAGAYLIEHGNFPVDIL